jgi:hypothetical protein
MKMSEVLNEEQRDKYCSDKCCGSDVKAEDCKCPPTCKHCNCNDPTVSEMTSAGSIASSMGGGNGFVNGGPGTLTRAGTTKKKKRKKKSDS